MKPRAVEITRLRTEHRPTGERLDILDVCRRFAEQEGRDLEEMVWVMVKGLLAAGALGNSKAAALVLEHLGRDPGKRIDVDVTVGAKGPPIPDQESLAARVAEIARTSVELSLVPVRPGAAPPGGRVPALEGLGHDMVEELLG